MVPSRTCAANPAKAPLLSEPQQAHARVLIIENPEATEAYEPKEETVKAMMNTAITRFSGTTSIADSWKKLVSTQDIVGIKVCAGPGPKIGTRLVVVEAVVEGLLQAKLPASNIVIWDKHESDLRRSGFFSFVTRYGVRVQGSAEAGYDEKAFYEFQILGQLIWGDVEFGRSGEGVGKKSFVSKLLTKQLTKIIQITPLLNHNRAGVTGNLYSLVIGSVDNHIRFEMDPERLARAVPEIYALPSLGDKVVLNIVDALVSQYQGEELSRLHYSNALNQLRLSTDPVALDFLSLQELDAQRKAAGIYLSNTNCLEIYSNAALLDLGVNDPGRIQVERIK
ncbi:MAG: hypothetical protein JWM16_5877 [Verrucomicrobiales bacterium]|nr:hypothetical protein [Verrucomicrobiales bacterium]